MDLEEARCAIELSAKDLGLTTQEMIKEIDMAIAEAMKNPDPLVQARWMFIPRSGDRPTALEFIAFMRKLVHRRER